ncbi:Homeodomain-like DNA binding domain-containing transcription factor [Mucor lusitanicus]|uniref:Homeodomain-like DNA binding domain-containing transcription factor n=1 Tax=Mucor circinelloides f. lusitanicus TaxID=29924 RepID=A0A8H4F1R8_MUCCL|nr:Homeodomain-like DNA binding domain-containing transcription factor [Mucor lusitanicus]
MIVLAGKDDEMSDRGTRPLVSWKALPVPNSIQINAAFLQKLRTPLPKPSVQQDQVDMKDLTIALFNSNSYKQSTKNFYKEEITDQEHAQINERVTLQQRQFANHESRQRIRMYRAIREVFDYLSDEEISDILKECENNEEKAICRLSEPGTLAQLRKTIALRYNKEETSYVPLIKSGQIPSQTAPKQATTKNRQPRTKLGLDAALKQITNTKSKVGFEGWSEARIRSFKMIEKNPNSYYYRFNEPGEEQRRGPWTEDEKKLFIDRLKVMGTEGQWGLFSKGIPGRVGYQCSNYYRFLIETKQLQDEKYVIASNGKPLYTFEKKLADGTIEKRLRTHNKSLNQNYASESHAQLANATPTDDKLKNPTKRKISNCKGTTKKVRRRHRLTMTKDSSSDSEIESYDNDASGNFVPRNYYRTRADKVQSEKYKQARCSPAKEGQESDSPTALQDTTSSDEYECLLPGFIDPITLDQVEKPAISKYGHVMGYDTWTRCLSNWQGGSTKNVCPITKQRLTKRDLVLLTSENLHLYKDKISNLQA